MYRVHMGQSLTHAHTHSNQTPLIALKGRAEAKKKSIWDKNRTYKYINLYTGCGSLWSKKHRRWCFKVWRNTANRNYQRLMLLLSYPQLNSGLLLCTYFVPNLMQHCSMIDIVIILVVFCITLTKQEVQKMERLLNWLRHIASLLTL